MKNLALYLLIFFLGGCASFLSDSSQPMTIDTPGCPGAECNLSNSKGSYVIGETPETISIRKSYGDLTVTCSKGDNIETRIYESSAVGAMYGNILLGGIIGGLIDAGTGKGFEYEDRLVHPLRCDNK